MVVPDCPTIGDTRVQAWHLRLRTHAHTSGRCSRRVKEHTWWLTASRRSTVVDAQDGCSAACQPAWRRSMVVPDCPVIGDTRVQASHLRLSTHVHTSGLAADGLSRHTPWPTRWRCSTVVNDDHG